jgi:hypothetical protein
MPTPWQSHLPGLKGRIKASSEAKPPPWPDIWIGCGRASIPLSIKLSRGVPRSERPRPFIVQLQDPRVAPWLFDLVIAPRHDRLKGDNVLSTLGPTHLVTAKRCKEAAAAPELAERFASLPSPRVAVLLGGSTKRAPLDKPTLYGWIDALLSACENGASLLIATSRRTGAEAEQRLRTALGSSRHVYWVDEEPGLDVMAALGLAEHVIVTSDSANMTVEACAVGKPVHVLAGPDPAAKFDRLHKDLAARGLTRTLSLPLQSWPTSPLQETQRVAGRVLEHWRRRQSALNS